jgi:hypothetical protein
MRNIKFDQLGRKAPEPRADAVIAAGPSLAARALAEAERVAVRPASPVPRPGSDSDAVVSAGSPKP